MIKSVTDNGIFSISTRFETQKMFTKDFSVIELYSV